MEIEENSTEFCEICDKSLDKCRCDVNEDEENTMFNPRDELGMPDNKDFSSM